MLGYFWLYNMVFSCPSSSIPILVIHSLIHCLEFSFRILTKPYQTYLNYQRYLLSWPTWSTWPPDIPTHLIYPPICPTHPPDFKLIHPDNLPEPTHNLPEPTYNLPEPTCSFRVSTKPYKAIPNLTEFDKSDQISQFWWNFTILTKFHNFNQISHFQPNITISTEFHYVYLISQSVPNFTILT